MSLEIYFDESNKLDKFASMFSYYGVIGCSDIKRKKLEEYKLSTGFKSELHFVEFEIKHLDYYIDIFNYSLDYIDTNIYIVNNDYALQLGDKLNINEAQIRNLFYMKIPERLIYGILRRLDSIQNIDIYLDEWDGYGNKNSIFFSDCNKANLGKIIINSNFNVDDKVKKIETLVDKIYRHPQLTKTLKEQLNSQAIYRDLNFKINKCVQAKSNEYIGLQIIDVLLGIFSFLFEEKYLETPKNIETNLFEGLDLTEEESKLLNDAYKKQNNKYQLVVKAEDVKTRKELKELNKKLKIYDTANIMKSEFIYRVLSNNDTLKKLLNLNIFTWPSNDDAESNSSIGKTYISKYVSVFLNFKNDFDNRNFKSILKFHNAGLSETKHNFSDYRKHLNYPSRLSKLVERYLTDLGINCLDCGK